MAPRISVVIEWENALLSDRHNVPSLFARLHEGIVKLSEPVELNIMFDSELVDKENLRLLLKKAGLADCASVDLTFRDAPGEHYYELKNLGAQRSSGEIVVFADSDIDPEENWINSLVHYLDHNEEIGMVGGFTYVKPTSIVAKAFAAGWFFPLKPADTDIVHSPAEFLWANNCAYRRSVFLAHPYRTSSLGETRNACHRQLDEMKGAGVRTANISSAVVAHPAPNGFRHFAVRGLAEGRDYAVDLLLSGKGTRSTPSRLRMLLFQIARKMKKTIANSVFEGKRLDIGLSETPIVILIMIVYYSLYTAGAIRTFIRPESTAGKWRI